MQVVLSLVLRLSTAAIAGLAIAATVHPYSFSREQIVSPTLSAAVHRPFHRQAQNAQTDTSPPVALKLGATLESKIEGSETQVFTLSVRPSEFARVEFEWQGMDLDISLRKSATGKILSVTRVRAMGSLPILILDSQGGDYRLEVRPVEKLKITGSYKVRLAKLGPPSADDQKRLDAANLLADAEREKSKETATAKYLQAIGLWREAGETCATTYSLQLLARRILSSPAPGESLKPTGPTEDEEYYQQAIEAGRSKLAPLQFAYLLLEIGSDYRRFDSPQKGLSYYSQALQKFREIGDRRGEASALYNQGFALARIGGDVVGALNLYQQALQIQRASHDSLAEATTLNAIGGAYNKLGDQQQALRFYGEAAPIWKTLNDRYREAIMINNVALAHDDLGDWQDAKDGYDEALGILNLVSKERGTNCLELPPGSDPRICDTIARVIDNLGELDNSLGNPQAALKRFETSLPIRQTLKQPQGWGATLSRMCYSYLLGNQPAKALEYCERALPLNQQATDVSKTTSTLTFMGMAHSALLNPTKARSYYQQALQLQVKDGERRSAAIVLDKIGLLYASLGDPKRSMTSYKEALQLWQGLKDQDGETITLHNMARAESADGNLIAANDYLQRAIHLVEFRRGRLTSQILRTTYFANKENYYELDIDLKMRLAKATGSQDYVALALGSSEKARARNLLDILKEANIKLDRSGNDPAIADPKLISLLKSQLVIARKLSAKANARSTLLGRKYSKEQEASFDKEIDELTGEYDRVEKQIRNSNPRYAELTAPQPLKAKDIQQQLLDDTTILIAYALGEQRSFVWAVTPTSIEAVELPARRTIEDAAERFSDLLQARNREERGETFAQKSDRVKRAEAEYPQAAQALSDMVLGKLYPLLGSKRLIIVADGVLQMIPFVSLPVPNSSTLAQDVPAKGPAKTDAISQMRLIDAHEIIYLPSASVLALQRSEMANRKRAPYAVAVLADPVFDQADERVAKSKGNGSPDRGEAAAGETNGRLLKQQPSSSSATSGSTNARAALATALRDVGLVPDKMRRLLLSRHEARAISSAVSPNQSFSALDFRASRETATSRELSNYRIIHFATHGILDLEHPELSGIVLSMVDEKGQPQDGYLRLHEIYNLNLPAELVVLSACQTGVGKQIKGEGLIALTRGFMYAGAKSVVASLWKVDDAATAELMAEFYKQMFTNKLKPAAALREAQVRMSQKKRWQSPYYWAGFFLQGEWN